MAYKDIEKRKKYMKEYELKRKRKRTPEYQRGITLKTLYGITIKDYNNLVEKQESKCAICNVYKEKLYVDHNHENGQVRALLCVCCNSGLGMFKDSIDSLSKAIIYLNTY